MSGDGSVPPSAMAAPIHEPLHMGFGNLGRATHCFWYMGKRIGYGPVGHRSLDVTGGEHGVVGKL